MADEDYLENFEQFLIELDKRADERKRRESEAATLNLDLGPTSQCDEQDADVECIDLDDESYPHDLTIGSPEQVSSFSFTIYRF
jgi:hypothetical protein